MTGFLFLLDIFIRREASLYSTLQLQREQGAPEEEVAMVQAFTYLGPGAWGLETLCMSPPLQR